MTRSLDPYTPGERVRWNWGPHTAEGVVREVFHDRVERVIKGARIVRNGERDNPVYLIEQDSGAKVLKKHSELVRV